MTKLKEIFSIIFRKNEEDDVKVKKTLPLKKKLALGGLGIIGLIGGIFALSKHDSTEYNDEDYFEDEEFDDYEDNETEEDLDDTDVSEEIEVETQA